MYKKSRRRILRSPLGHNNDDHCFIFVGGGEGGRGDLFFTFYCNLNEECDSLRQKFVIYKAFIIRVFTLVHYGHLYEEK